MSSLGKFIDYLIEGLSCQEESVKSSLVYVLVQLCSKSTGQLLQTACVRRMCSLLSVSLATAKSHYLTLNLMGMIIYMCV